MKKIKKLSIVLLVALFAVTLNISTVPQNKGVAIHMGSTVAKADVNPGPIMPVIATSPEAISINTTK